MEVLRPADAAAFLELAGPLLERDEARHNLILGIAGTLRHEPEIYPVFHLWVAVHGGRPVGAALQTEPYNLVLADPEDDAALDALLSAVEDDRAPIPGILGNRPHVDDAARRWATRTGIRPQMQLAEGVYALTRVRDVPRPPGRARPATPADRDVLVEWTRAFAHEALPDPERELDGLEETIDARLIAGSAGSWFWEVEGRPTALAGYAGRTLTGIRVGPVFTPMEHRRRGYATRLVADLSAHLLETGYRACFLYTDLSNPTSNAIYERIGYERVCDAAMIRFLPPP